MSGWPAGFGRVVLDAVDSTNDEARRRAANGADLPLWIAARQQIAGRGRHGRVWTTDPGNLAATLLLGHAGGPAEAARLGFPASLAVADMLVELVPGATIKLKWPNDVLLGGRKVSGILLESFGHGLDDLLLVAIGIGVNLAHHPPREETRWPATSIADEAGTTPAFEDALAGLARRMAHWLDVLDRAGFAAIRTAWLSRADRLGETIEARLPRAVLSGRFAEIDAEGALILETSSGRRRVAAGDVFFHGGA